MLQKVVFYARVSTEEEKQLNALQGQIEELTNFVHKHSNWVLVGSYVDEGKTGTTAKGRKDYQRLFDDIGTDKFDIILIKDQSRLMRNVLDWYLFLDKVTKNNKKIYLYLENNFYSPDNAFIAGIKAMMAEEYSRDLSKKINSSVKRNHEKGVQYGNGLIWGYDFKDGKYVINEKEAQVVRRVFDMYVQGCGVRKIFQQLTDDGITSRNGTPFSLSVLKRMIRNEKYKGTLVSGKTHKNFETKKITATTSDQWIYHDNVIPAIVSNEVWERANMLLKERRKTYDDNNSKHYTNAEYYGRYLGSTVYAHKLICGHCGETYWKNTYTTKKNKEFKVDFSCKSGRIYNASKCKNTHIHLSVLDELVKSAIHEIWGNKQNLIEEIIRDLSNIVHDDEAGEAEKLRAAKKSLEDKNSKLLDLYLDGALHKEEYQQKKIALAEELRQIEMKLAKTSENGDIINTRMFLIVEKLKKLASDALETPDEFINVLVDKIVVNSKDGSNWLTIHFINGVKVDKPFAKSYKIS